MSRTKQILLRGLTLGTISVVILVVLAPVALAGPAGTTVKGGLGDDLKGWTANLAALNTFCQILLLMILDFLGYLLQGDYFTNVQMQSALASIWRLSRDLMNLLFALMLIGVAFYTIIVGKKDFIMGKLTHFILAVILVNFSWFYPRVIIDIANVVSATVYSIPQMLTGFTCQSYDENGIPGPCYVVTDKLVFGDKAEQAAWVNNKCGGPTPNCPCYEYVGCYKKVVLAAAIAGGDMNSSHAMINGMAVSFAKILEIPKIPNSLGGPGPTSTGAAIKISIQILMNILMAFFIQFAMILPLMGMAFGFLARILILWVTTAFMPFTFLGLVINGKLGTNVFGFEIDIWQEFINAAFLPAVVGIPITIGFIMLSAASSIPAPANPTITWMVPLLAGVKNWWAMIWMFAAVAIMWKGAFAALAKSKLIGGVTEKLRGFGEYAFKGAMQLPLLTPLPGPAGARGMNLGTLVNAPKMIGESARMAAGGYSGKGFLETLSQRLGGGQLNSDASQAEKSIVNGPNAQNLINALTALKAGGTDAQIATHMNTIKTAMGPHMSVRSSDEVGSVLKDIVKRGGADGKLGTVNETLIQDAMAKAKEKGL